jgi:5-formyltetrahydrofolate cyclo-ligase
MIKKIIRVKLQKLRGSLSNSFVKQQSKKVHTQLFNFKILNQSKKIALYFSKDNEVNTKNLIMTLLNKPANISLPKIIKQNICLKQIAKIKDLEIGTFKIFEPKSSCQTVKLSEFDTIIVPCIAVDIDGNRIGRGKGFYDRLLCNKNKKTTIICLAYEFQVIDKIKPSIHDQAVDFIVTENRVIKIR